MRKSVIPAVRLPRADHGRLLQLARLASRDDHPVAAFLLAEVDRARVVDDAAEQGDVVVLDRWVTYRIDDGPIASHILVHPEAYVDARRQLSVLSPVGAALVGIPVGEPMPFATIEGVPRVVTALSVDPEPKVTSLTQWRRPAPRTAEHDPYDPGPSAA
ncbi:hypothetical protein GJ689_13635 [Rhodoplanes serenus]|uniref:Regulator of nucleoside diphosphate kinase n=1 Tax=Rhodoplanes serenus TaxID=200615 RepID=A0A3S4CGT8_9BRAD|nr:GreA/GreB family elongation factor [Rhodoplanes serenus]MBI5114593.1 GreA/GreB family elongation factor [Rhodovulum sp.]MTW17246.1 hypothetical protein [Rhodoplanes serenus]VCU08819.1 Regulator of nucleoside diphosphate kinase [Rhodoplanes serenus]